MTNPKEEPATITQGSKISLALVIVIVSGIIGNVGMMFDLKGDVALVQRDVVHVMSTTEDIKEDIAEITAEYRKGLESVRLEVSTLKEQIFSLRSRIAELERHAPK